MTCDQGHNTPHATRVAGISLKHHGYFDLPQIPERFWGESYQIEVLNPTGLPHRGGYCPAFGPLQHNVFEIGMWEPCETIAMLIASEKLPAATFYDFGANIGWFSVLMARRDHYVVAIEADDELADVLDRNLHGMDECSVRHEEIGPESHVATNGNRAIVKIDIEGAEEHAIAALNLDDVDVLLVEMSPVFNDSYYDIASKLRSAGFRWAELPDKSVPPAAFDTYDDLDFQYNGLKNRLTEVAQINVLFVRPELL